ncbi:MAG TPA: hypothetical protein VGM78_09675 [Ilumatobacteraceae bacterium]
MMNKALTLAFGSAIGLVALTGCGSSSKKAAPTTTLAPASAATVAAGGAATGATTPAAVTTPVAAGGSGSSSDFCALSKEFKDEFGNNDSDISDDTPDQIKAYFTKFDADLATWEAAAPAELKAAILEDTKSFTEIEALLAKDDYDFSKLAEDPAAAALDTTETTDATGKTADDQITAYMQTTCGITDDTIAS